MLQLSYANDIFGLREFALMPRHELCRCQLSLWLLFVFHSYLSDAVNVRCTWNRRRFSTTTTDPSMYSVGIGGEFYVRRMKESCEGHNFSHSESLIWAIFAFREFTLMPAMNSAPERPIAGFVCDATSAAQPR